jgi:hypothetical protein
VSRSWIRKRTLRFWSSSSMSTLRACWIIQAVSGFAVQATNSTRRVASERKTSTYSRFSRTVSTVKKITGERRSGVLAQE